MNTLILIVPAVVLLIVAVVLLVVLLSLQRFRKRDEMHRAFGPDCAGYQAGPTDRPHAEEVAERGPMPAPLAIRPLSPASRQRYLSAWDGAESRAVDAPVLALSEADALVTRLLAERGFPVSDGRADDDRRQRGLLSAEHRGILQRVGAGRAIERTNSSDRADLEQVRQGLEHFRSVFQALIGLAGKDAVDEPYVDKPSAATRRSLRRAPR